MDAPAVQAFFFLYVFGNTCSRKSAVHVSAQSRIYVDEPYHAAFVPGWHKRDTFFRK